MPFSSTSSPAFTQTPVPLEQLLNELDSKVRMPIMLPSQLPMKGKVYPQVSVGFSGESENGPYYYDNQYFIDFNTSPNCKGTPDCSLVSFSGTLNGNFFFWVDTDVPATIQVGDRIVQILDAKEINLSNQWGESIPAKYTRQCGLRLTICGANELATLEWFDGGVKYSVTVVNGAIDDVVQIANSTIKGGIRNRVRVQSNW